MDEKTELPNPPDLLFRIELYASLFQEVKYERAPDLSSAQIPNGLGRLLERKRCSKCTCEAAAHFLP
jgi:hypothetical protein